MVRVCFCVYIEHTLCDKIMCACTHAYTRKNRKTTIYLFTSRFLYGFAAIQNFKLFNHHYFKMVMLFRFFLVRSFVCLLVRLFVFLWFVGFCCLLFVMSSYRVCVCVCFFLLTPPPPHNHFYQVYSIHPCTHSTHSTHAKRSAWAHCTFRFGCHDITS